MEIPNVVDMIFGRIDRNNDTQYRDRALAQNQSQFTAAQQLDRERLAAQKEEFYKKLAFDQSVQEAAQQAALAHAINAGLVSQEGGGPASAPAGGMNNMFMPPDGSAPGVGGVRLPSQPTVPGMPVTIGGRRVIATPQAQLFATQLQQKGQLAQQEYIDKQKHKADTFNFLNEAGVPSVYAAMAAERPEVLQTLLSDPRLAVGLLSTGKNIPKPIMDQFLQGFKSATNAGIPDTTASLNAAQIKNQEAQAAWHNAQSLNMKPASPEGSMLYSQAVAEASKRYQSSDPNFMGAVHTFITNSNMSPSAKQDAIGLAVKDISQRTMGENPFQTMMRMSGQPGQSQYPPGVTNPNPQAQPTTGAGGNNSKPAAVTGPPGTQVVPNPNGVRRPSSLDFLMNNPGSVFRNGNPIPQPVGPPPVPQIQFGTGDPARDEFLRNLMIRPPQQ